MAKLPSMDKKIKSVTIKPIYDTTATQYFMDVKNGKCKVEYLHKDLEPILSGSNGVFQYQEEVMRFLVEIGGYSWEESDIIRSAIAKKKHEVIMASFDRIRKSCRDRGWSAAKIETICQQIMAFSRYSFNKSHSYAYGELGYITLYLKHHYPLEWWCGVLNNEDKEDKTRKYISYLGDKISAPSLKNPKNEFTISDGKILAPISAIKAVGPSVLRETIAKGPFASLEDFIERVDHTRVNIGAMSALIKARAADDLFFDKNSGISYIEQRTSFMRKYSSLRKSKSEFKPDMYDLNPINIFLQEKEYNLSFNKSLLSSPEILEILKQRWSGLKATGRGNIPLSMGKDGQETWILNGVKSAESFLNKGFSQDVGMILLFDSSNYKTGVSKKGKTWHRVSVMLSDGFNMLEATLWDTKKAFGWPKDTIVYIRGQLKTGWKTSISLNIEEIEKVQ